MSSDSRELIERLRCEALEEINQAGPAGVERRPRRAEGLSEVEPVGHIGRTPHGVRYCPFSHLPVRRAIHLSAFSASVFSSTGPGRRACRRDVLFQGEKQAGRGGTNPCARTLPSPFSRRTRADRLVGKIFAREVVLS